MTPKITATQAELFDRFARFYDADYRHYQDDLDLILDLADQTGDPILELGCGTGRVLAPLLEAGHTVTGVDISPGLLGVAQEHTTKYVPPSRPAHLRPTHQRVRLCLLHQQYAHAPDDTGGSTDGFA